jgi:hypothetical protein
VRREEERLLLFLYLQNPDLALPSSRHSFGLPPPPPPPERKRSSSSLYILSLFSRSPTSFSSSKPSSLTFDCASWEPESSFERTYRRVRGADPRAQSRRDLLFQTPKPDKSFTHHALVFHRVFISIARRVEKLFQRMNLSHDSISWERERER